MKLEYKNDYHSIKNFNSVNLPDFTILTGINGSGKTHLLKAIKSGNVQIDTIDDANDIVYFDYHEFRVSNEPEQNSFQLRQEQNSAWEFFNSQNITNFGNLKNRLLAVKSEFFPQTANSEIISNIAKQKNLPLQFLTKNDLDEESFQNLLKYNKRLKQLFSHPELIKNSGLLPAIIFISTKYSSFIDELTYDEFMTLFEPIHLKENLLPIEIGKIFLKYRITEFKERSINFQKLDKNTSEIIKMVDEKCKKRYGGHTPWEIVNSFLNTFTNFDYEISYPKELDLDNYSNQNGLHFTPVLEDKKRNVSIPYSQLSSGEQILFSLALCLFKSKSDNLFPKLLLLDEIDATLHPSMIENLLNVISELFLKNGTKVILSTHSPTTIALAEEDSVYLVNKTGLNRIEKNSKTNALSILTEGFATLEEGLRLSDQLTNKEITIITEGKNVDYIKKAMSLFSKELNEKIAVLEGVEAITGKDQLRLFWEFFSSIPKTKKILFVWDSDADKFGSFETKNNTYAYSFQKNPLNHIAESGIENLFDEALFEGFTKTITDDGSGAQMTNFDTKKYKSDFLKKVMVGDETMFKNFKPLFDHIEKILNSN